MSFRKDMLTDIVTDFTVHTRKQKEYSLLDIDDIGFDLSSFRTEVSDGDIEEKLIKDLRNSLHGSFWVDSWSIITSNLWLKSIIVSCIWLIGGIDIAIKCYAWLAVVAIFSGICADIKEKRIGFKRSLNKLLLQFFFLLTISIANIFPRIAEVAINNQSLTAPLKGWAIIFFAYVNLNCFIVSAKELGVPIPNKLGNIPKWLKRIEQ